MAVNPEIIAMGDDGTEHPSDKRPQVAQADEAVAVGRLISRDRRTSGSEMHAASTAAIYRGRRPGGLCRILDEFDADFVGDPGDGASGCSGGEPNGWSVPLRWYFRRRSG